MTVFSIEDAIGEFVSDPLQTSLELPHMTTGQRKQVKKLLGGHPELICESFGFGAERKLHIFKKGQRPEAASSTCGGTEECGASASLPLTEVKEAPRSPGQSTTASARSTPERPSNAENQTLSQLLKTLELPTPSDMMQVRNTFIEVKDLPVNERAVQSMPHDMFGRLLENEAARAKDSSTSTDSAPEMEAALLNTMTDECFFSRLDMAAKPAEMPSQVAPAQAPFPAAWFPDAPALSLPVQMDTPPPPPDHLAAGTEVVIEGLSKNPAFNGLRAVVQSLDEASGRYNLLVTSPGSPGGQQWAKVRGENLRLVPLTPPPSFEPGMTMSAQAEPAAMDQVVTWLNLTAMV